MNGWAPLAIMGVEINKLESSTDGQAYSRLSQDGAVELSRLSNDQNHAPEPVEPNCQSEEHLRHNPSVHSYGHLLGRIFDLGARQEPGVGAGRRRRSQENSQERTQWDGGLPGGGCCVFFCRCGSFF